MFHPRYEEVAKRIHAIGEGETDQISLMATLSCELFHEFEHFHWVGFYRKVGPELLKIGPYQGGHGCLVIPFNRGVCGACARTEKTIIVDDVDAFEGHIACASTTQSEIVVPVLDQTGELIAVFDVDSDLPAAFDTIDGQNLEKILMQVFSKSS